MALPGRRQRRVGIDIWPGFVDALSQLLIIIIFVVMIFTAAQFYLTRALSGSESRLSELSQQIADLTSQLNLIKKDRDDLRVSLAQTSSELQELASYRSEFFGRLREILGNRPDIRIVGDRFVFQSEVLFSPGNADLGAEARHELDLLGGALRDIAAKIPAEIPWVLRVDGHPDRRPISTSQFPSNWELSTARATAVVKALVEQGIPP